MGADVHHVAGIRLKQAQLQVAKQCKGAGCGCKQAAAAAARLFLSSNGLMQGTRHKLTRSCGNKGSYKEPSAAPACMPRA